MRILRPTNDSPNRCRRRLNSNPAVGYVENIGVFFPGLTTVAVPFVSETVQTEYVLNCTSPADALSTPALRAEAGEALKMLAERLRPAIVRKN